MRNRWLCALASQRLLAPANYAALAVIVVALTAACSAAPGKSSSPTTSGSPGTTGPTPTTGQTGSASTGSPCGTTKTAVNVPVQIEVSHGKVPCSTAMAIERDYTNAILAGAEPGNGGGGPVKIHGWTCQGFATPVVLQTGQASKCVQGNAEILAILPAPT